MSKVMKSNEKTNSLGEKLSKMTLKGYYERLESATYPKTEFVNRVAFRTGATASTVRNWIAGRTKPEKPEHIQVLVEVTGIPAEELWME